MIVLADDLPDVLDLPEDRDPHRTGDDRDMRGQRTFFEDHALEPAPVIFEQFSRTQVAGNQDRVLPQTHFCRSAHLAGNGAQQTIGKVFQIMHALGQKRIIDLPHPHTGMLLHSFDRRFGSQAAVDRFIDAPAPAFIIGKHLICLEHFLMLAADTEFRLTGHQVDLGPHLVERGIDPMAFRLGIFRDRMLDFDSRLMEDRVTAGFALDQLQTAEPISAIVEHRRFFSEIVVDKFGAGDQFRQNHCSRLESFNFYLGIAARFDMLGA